MVEQIGKANRTDDVMNTSKSLEKKNVKKRKIDECKTHKINWGSSQKY